MRRLAPFFARSGAGLLALALPPRCPGCGAVIEADHIFCALCWQGMNFLGDPCCAQCGDPFDHDRGQGVRCEDCISEPPAFDRARAAVVYGALSRRIALKLKYGGRQGLAQTMARRLDRHIGPGEGVLVTPVPLHRWRVWARGYNQAALIARAVAKRNGLPLALDLLHRTRATPLLRGLGRRARANAVRGAFTIDERRRASIQGRTILLIDDVLPRAPPRMPARAP